VKQEYNVSLLVFRDTCNSGRSAVTCDKHLRDQMHMRGESFKSLMEPNSEVMLATYTETRMQLSEAYPSEGIEHVNISITEHYRLGLQRAGRETDTLASVKTSQLTCCMIQALA
jgi:hypothetical protein